MSVPKAFGFWLRAFRCEAVDLRIMEQSSLIVDHTTHKQEAVAWKTQFKINLLFPHSISSSFLSVHCLLLYNAQANNSIATHV